MPDDDQPSDAQDEATPAPAWEPPGFRRTATRAPLQPGARAPRRRRSNYFAKIRVR